jgi:hypothetical protein
MSLPVRELLAGYLQKRHDVILRRLMAQVQSAPDLDEVRALSQSHDYQKAVSDLMLLLIRNIANPSDRRCFDYFSQRAGERFRQNVPAVQMLRVVALHRQILHKMVARQFTDEPGASRRMIEIIDEQFREVELALSNSYQSQRDEHWRFSETKYFALFENASEAILSFRPGEGLIIEANMQCARLLGRERPALLETPFVELFTPEHREQAQWLVEHQAGTSNVRVEDMTIRRSDGLAVPVSLSCNWAQIEGHGSVAQIIMRDITQLRQMQRALRDYADQLENRVALRTGELQHSQQRYRSLFLQEQRRAQHLELVNSIGKYSFESLRLAKPDETTFSDGEIAEFLHDVAATIHQHFAECDVTIYLCERDYADLLQERALQAPLVQPCAEGDCGDLIVAAQTGGRGLAPPPGMRHPFSLGLAGAAACSGHIVLVEREAWRDERYLRPPGTHRDADSQICVPVMMEDTVIGVITLQAEAENSFEERDAGALQTVASIVAGHLQSSRVLREMRNLSEFHQTLTNTMLHSLVITGWDEEMRVVNERFCQTLRVQREAVLGRPLDEILGEAMARHELREKLREVRATGTTHEVQDVHVRVRPEGYPEYGLVFDVRMFRIYFRGEPQVVVLMINVTARWRREQEMRLMNETGRLLQSSLDVATVLHAVLTCITAGSALGFNRAFVFLREENGDVLRAARALGPSSYEEAQRIWWELSQQKLSLPEILAESPADAPRTPLQEHIVNMTLDLSNPTLPALTTVVREGSALKVTPEAMFLEPEKVFASQNGTGEKLDSAARRRDEEYRREYLMARELFTAGELAIAPLVTKDRVIGVVLADNIYSGTSIDDQALQTLETLAHQAGLAIDNARTYQALQRAQNDLLSADRLVVIGELAARISHEIRNPLATIGGWAHNLQRKADNPADVMRKAGIIVEEVNRLESLLTDVLGMAKARPLNLEAQQVNEIVERALLLAEGDIRANHVEVVKQFSDLPLALVDRNRLLQAMLNLIRNGAQSMSDKPDGKLHLATRLCPPPDSVAAAHPETPSLIEIEVRDEGRGISQQALKQVFDPFFSTKLSGSGLGLSVTRRIVQDHGGEISVESQPGEGTTFVLRLPFHAVPPAIPLDSSGEEEISQD